MVEIQTQFSGLNELWAYPDLIDILQDPRSLRPFMYYTLLYVPGHKPERHPSSELLGPFDR